MLFYHSFKDKFLIKKPQKIAKNLILVVKNYIKVDIAKNIIKTNTNI